MTAGLAIRALATNNRRRSVARAKLTVIYAAPGFLRKGLKRIVGSVLLPATQ